MSALDRIFRRRQPAAQTLEAQVQNIIRAAAAQHQCVWYDPSDLSTMFQDSAGTTPVTAVEQSVGLILDKSKGLARGAEKVTNGDFSSATGWTVTSGWSVDTATGKAVATNAPGSPLSNYLLQTGMGISPNRLYEVTYTVSDYVSGWVAPIFYGSNQQGVTRTANGTYTELMFAQSTVNGNFGIAAVSGQSQYLNCKIDNISVRELAGNHASQATTGSKPVLSARVNLMTSTEFAVGLADAPVRGGAISASSLTGYAGALAFGYDAVNGTYAYKSQPHTNGVTYRFSVRVKMDDGGVPRFGPAYDSLTDFNFVIGGNVVQPTARLNPDGTYTAYADWVSTGSGTNCGVLKYGVNSNRTFKCTGYDFRPANIPGCPEYQRVNTASDYDTIGFPKYLDFDGLDDFLVTGNVDFSSSDKIAVAAGVRKLSDASVSVISEFSGDTNSNAGSFGLYGTVAAGSPSSGFKSRGTASASWATTPIPSPVSAIISGLGDVIVDKTLLRVNGADKSLYSGDQGAGNYGIYPLYIGRRGGTSLPYNGRLYGLAICGGMDDITMLRKIERLLAKKTGVTV